MALADSLKRITFRCRAIPGRLGIRPYSVAVRTAEWNGTNTGRGAEAVDYVSITEANGQNPKVRQLSTEELALGNLGKGAIQIGPITPEFSVGGTPITDILGGDLRTGMTRTLRLTGPGTKECGDLYVIKDVKTDRALHWTITAEPVE